MSHILMVFLYANQNIEFNQLIGFSCFQARIVHLKPKLPVVSARVNSSGQVGVRPLGLKSTAVSGYLVSVAFSQAKPARLILLGKL